VEKDDSAAGLHVEGGRGVLDSLLHESKVIHSVTRPPCDGNALRTGQSSHQRWETRSSSHSKCVSLLRLGRMPLDQRPSELRLAGSVLRAEPEQLEPGSLAGETLISC